MAANLPQFQSVFGIVPSRRLGQSLGISPIPKKTCNYSCVYCQLGRTLHYVEHRQYFFSVKFIIDELKTFLKSINSKLYDVITIVGDGEPTLYRGLGNLIHQIKAIQSKPVAVISNGALLTDPDVRNEIAQADIVLLNFDSWDEASHKKINRPLKSITFSKKYAAYQKFRQEFRGILYFEVMLVKGLNDSEEKIQKIAQLIQPLHPTQVFINSPVRPPAESWVKIPDQVEIEKAHKILAATNIAYLPHGDFTSTEEKPIDAILNIVGRHPMCLEDIKGFVAQRYPEHSFPEVLASIRNSPAIQELVYGSNHFFRKNG
ncbi:MAG: radical SAM protein [Promethearchaeota archaeon]